MDWIRKSTRAIQETSGITAQALTRGAGRLLESQGFSALTEFCLGNSRRADLAAINRRGTLVIVEVKSSIADFRSDNKWPEYLPYCDRFYFCVSPEFPQPLLAEQGSQPGITGVIVADAHGGAVLRAAAHRPLNAGRRKAETLRFARHSANRLWRSGDIIVKAV